MFFFNSCGFHKSRKISLKNQNFQKFSKISKICSKISIVHVRKKSNFFFRVLFRNFIFESFSQLSNSFSKFKFRFPKFHIMESVIKCHWIWCSFCSYSDIGVFIEIHFNYLFQTFYENQGWTFSTFWNSIESSAYFEESLKSEGFEAINCLDTKKLANFGSDLDWIASSYMIQTISYVLRNKFSMKLSKAVLND